MSYVPISRIFTILILLGTFGLAGCNTIEGFGKDTQAAGEAIEDTAEDASE